MEEDLVKFWEIRRGGAAIEIYAFGNTGSALYIGQNEASPSLALCREFEELTKENLPGIVRYRENHGVFGNEYPRARAVVEYLLKNDLIAVDEAKYVGPEYDPTYNGAEIADLSF